MRHRPRRKGDQGAGRRVHGRLPVGPQRAGLRDSDPAGFGGTQHRVPGRGAAGSHRRQHRRGDGRRRRHLRPGGQRRRPHRRQGERRGGPRLRDRPPTGRLGTRLHLHRPGPAATERIPRPVAPLRPRLRHGQAGRARRRLRPADAVRRPGGGAGGAAPAHHPGQGRDGGARHDRGRTGCGQDPTGRGAGRPLRPGGVPDLRWPLLRDGRRPALHPRRGGLRAGLVPGADSAGLPTVPGRRGARDRPAGPQAAAALH